MNNKVFFGFKKKPLKHWFFYWSVVGGSIFVLFFLITTTVIGDGVRQRCVASQARYGGTCTEALISNLQDPEAPYGEKNSSIWALGQLGNKKALPILKDLYTGQIPNREPWNQTLSQYELKKAINLLESGFNISAFVWRGQLIKALN
ncbi:hypothetical protein ACFLZP_01200 [Patescibacteria group bacterium]